MDKRETIREGFAQLDWEESQEEWIRANDDFAWENISESDRESMRERADMFLSYLHSQGLVIQVERELPNWISSCPSANSETCKTCDNCEIFDFALFDIIEAGYAAVEKLIGE